MDNREKQQKIVVVMTLTSADIDLIDSAASLAAMFKKGLCLLYTDRKQLSVVEHFEKEKRKILNDYPGLEISSFSISVREKMMAAKLADEHEAILFVVASSDFRKMAVPLRHSPVPFLFIKCGAHLNNAFKTIIVPIDMRRQNEDSMLWSVYFGRNNGSEVIAIGANDRDADSQGKVRAHLVSLKKLLLKFSIPHKIYKGKLGSMGVHREGLIAATQHDGPLLLLLGSSVVTWLDLLLGLPEEKTIKKSGNIPVLVVNPRRESYLLCD